MESKRFVQYVLNSVFAFVKMYSERIGEEGNFVNATEHVSAEPEQKASAIESITSQSPPLLLSNPRECVSRAACPHRRLYPLQVECVCVGSIMGGGGGLLLGCPHPSLKVPQEEEEEEKPGQPPHCRKLWRFILQAVMEAGERGVEHGW